MAKEAGVVKSVNGGIARALNDLTGEVRQLSVGDIVYQGEKIVTEGSNSKVTITQTDGKDITLIGKDTLTLDQDSNNNETVADISALQQAILKGTDLNALEETAAGGPQAGGNGGDGVSLSSTSFAEGGHISNINANVGSIDALALASGGDNSFGVSGGSAVGAGAGTEATGPALPAGSIKIPLSAYKGESTSSALLDSFASSIPNGYHVYRHTDGRDYLTPNDPTAPSAFDYKEGWYVSKDGNLAIGQDNAKDLAVTSTAKASNYPDDGSVAKIVNPNPNLKVFGSDNVDNITVDGTRITSVRGGVGNDNVDLKNGAEAKGVSGGSGSDNITVDNSTISGKTITNSDGSTIREAITGDSGEDTISVTNSYITGNIDGGADNDRIDVFGTGIKDGYGKVVGDINGGDGNDYINVMTDVEGNINAGRSSNSGELVVVGDNHLRYEDRINIGAVPTPGTSVTINGNVTADGNVTMGASDVHIKGSIVANSASNQSANISVGQNAEVDGDIIGGHGKDFIDISGYHDGTKNAVVHGKVDAREGDDRIDVYNGSVEGLIEGGKGDDMFNLYKGSRINGINDIEGNSQLQVNKTTVDSNLNFNGDTKIEVIDGGNISTNLNLSHNNRITAMGDDAKITGDINFSGNGKQFVSAVDGGEIGTVNLGNGQNEVVVGSGRSGTYQDSKIDNVNGGGGTDTIKAFSGGTINNLNIKDGNGDDTISRFSTESYDDMGQHTKGEGVINHIQKDSGDNEIHGRVINKITNEGEERHIIVDSSENSNIDLSSIMEHGLSQNHAGVMNHVYDSIDISNVANARLKVNIADVLNVPEKNHGIDEIETVLKLKYGSDDRVTLENSGSKNGWHEITNDGDASNKTYKAELDHDGNTYSVIIKVDNDSITPDI